MFSHVTIGTHNLERAIAFYDATLLHLGIERVSKKYPNWAAWQRQGEDAKFWVGLPYNQLPASWGNGCRWPLPPNRAPPSMPRTRLQ